MRQILIVTLLISSLALTGCGSDASAPVPPPTNNNPPTPPSGPIEGVATPDSVAVVTATNAQ